MLFLVNTVDIFVNFHLAAIKLHIFNHINMKFLNKFQPCTNRKLAAVGRR